MTFNVCMTSFPMTIVPRESSLKTKTNTKAKATKIMTSFMLVMMIVCGCIGHVASSSSIGMGASGDNSLRDIGTGTGSVGVNGSPQPCTRKMELQSPILYKLCLYYTHETGIEELEHEDGRWIEDAKNLLLANSGAAEGSLKREEQPRVHHMFIRFGRRR